MRRAFAVAVMLAASCGCAHSSSTATTAAASSAASPGTVGYVRMDELVKRHPLYAQLARYDDDIQALSLRSIDVPKPSAELAREDAALQAQLHTAAERTDRLLKAKQVEYGRRENAAIARALQAEASAGGAPNDAQLAAQMNATTNEQRSVVASAAERDLEHYRQILIRSDSDELRQASKNLSARATRTYAAKAEELQSKESELSLTLASQDASERLSLRTRLSNLALDDTERDSVHAQLDGLDRKESDAVAAEHNRDAQTLVKLRDSLRAQIGRELSHEATVIHAQSLAKLRARENGARLAFAHGTLPSLGPAASGTPGPLPSGLRTRIAALHKAYQLQFNADAKATVADFTRTRSELQLRFNTLHGVDRDAQSGAQKQIAALQHERDDLYAQMVAQIDREVRTLAQSRGISVVFDDLAAPAGGVDLTADAQKEIESLHE